MAFWLYTLTQQTTVRRACHHFSRFTSECRTSLVDAVEAC
jgi:hypothetical protein